MDLIQVIAMGRRAEQRYRELHPPHPESPILSGNIQEWKAAKEKQKADYEAWLSSYESPRVEIE